MPALDFPNTPAVGDKWPAPPEPNKPVYIWDGVKWTTNDSNIASVVGPSILLPKMDGVAATGVENNWSRGDHVHPSDTSRLAAADFTAYNQSARTNVSLTGSSVDIAVPATAKLARLTGVLWNATTATCRVQASVTPGVFVTTSPNYIVNGVGYNSGGLGAIVNRAATSESGFVMHGAPSADNLAQPAQFDAVIALVRSDASRVFNCESQCGYFSGTDNWHWSFTTYLIATAGGTSLNIVALRLLSTSAWSTGSYLTVEWLGQ